MEVIERTYDLIIAEEQLTAEPHLHCESTPNRQIIELGNTGFSLHFERDLTTLRFIPEDDLYFTPERSARNSSILATSLYNLYKFLNNSSQLEEFGIDINRLSWISSTLDTRLIFSIRCLFTHHGHSELTAAENLGRTLMLDLQGFKNLKPNDILVSYLDKVAQRASRLTITTYKTQAEA